MPVKELLNAMHDVVRFVGHIALIPVIAALKAIATLAQHLIAELEKI